jgi:hypothetical protein
MNTHFPELIRAEAENIMSQHNSHDPQVANDTMNARLKALWEKNADALGVPVKSLIQVNPEYIQMHRDWGWDTQWLKKLSDAPYMIVSEYRGGGPCVVFNDGTWDGGVEFDVVLRCRQAWLEREATS